ncbi:MAG TPA: MOSC N-terminal beta barrel domain-containing protein [Planktothrix sp.]|jgi:hypothetical protein
MQGQVSGLYIYPVKSCAAVPLKQAHCGIYGLQHDREWVIVSEGGQMLTQRDEPRMALIQPAVDENGTLTLSAPDRAPLTVSKGVSSCEPAEVDVWGRMRHAATLDLECGQWLSQFLGVGCRLLRSVQLSGDGASAWDGGTFTDMYPLTVIGEDSLARLNDRLEEPVSMDRFRPSIVLSGVGSHAEDSFETITIGSVTLRQLGSVPRCVIVMVDQVSGKLAGTEPMRTLSTYRWRGGKVMFGQYFQTEQPGLIRLGDPIDAVAHAV